MKQINIVNPKTSPKKNNPPVTSYFDSFYDLKTTPFVNPPELVTNNRSEPEGATCRSETCR